MNRRLMSYFQIFTNTLIQPLFRKTQLYSRSVTRAPSRWVRKLSSVLSKAARKKETSLKDYVEFRNHYVSKRALIIGALLLLVGIYMGGAYVKGQLKFHTILYSNNITNFTGNAKVFDNKENKFLLYQGEIKDGWLHGRGTSYYPSEKSTVKYTGDFQNGLPHGNGAYYTEEGAMLYQGGVVLNRYDGQGKLFWDGTTVKYEGEFKNGEYNGNGKLYSEQGALLYSGLFENGDYATSGKIYYSDGTLKYEGGLNMGEFDGNGKMYSPTGKLAYSGGFKDSLYDGDGEKYNELGHLTVAGQFQKGLPNGDCTEYYSNGSIRYKGAFKNGFYDGEGTGFYDNEANTPKYSGFYKAGKYDGVGKLFNESNELIYEGEFAAGLGSGFGIAYSGPDIVYTGDFSGGKYDGFGTLLGPKGAIVYTGFFKLGNTYPQGFLNITEIVLEEKLGPPAKSYINSGNLLTHVYETPAMAFRMVANSANSDMTVASLLVYDVTSLFGLDVSMTASEVETLLGPPSKAYEAPLPTEDLTDDQAALYSPDEQVKFLVYSRPGYTLQIPFATHETQMLFIELLKPQQ